MFKTRSLMTALSVATASCLAVALTSCTSSTTSEQAAQSNWPQGIVEIMAPGSAGGGFDSVARAMQGALAEEPFDANARVKNVSGAGGTVGLQEFVTNSAGDPNKLIVAGRTMLSSIMTEQSSADLDDANPIATLITTYVSVAVRADSPYQSINDLVSAFAANPRSVVWGGGSIGGTDHLVVAALANDAGVNVADVNYIAHSGGAEQSAALLSGAETVSVSRASEQLGLVKSGDIRYLAVTSPERLPGVDAPTLTESGIDVEIANWSMVMAAPGISDEQKTNITQAMLDMVKTEAWQSAAQTNLWTEFVLTGTELDSFLADERITISEALNTLGLL